MAEMQRFTATGAEIDGIRLFGEPGQEQPTCLASWRSPNGHSAWYLRPCRRTASNWRRIDIDSELKHYYEARAPYYDAVYDKPERQADIAHLKAWLAERFRGRRVIEVACGTGYWTDVIASAASGIVALDIAAEPLRFARLRPNSGSVDFREVDAFELPATLGKFDAAFSGLWLSHVPVERRSEFIKGVHRLLTPGAIVVLIDNSQVQLKEFPIVETDPAGNTYQRRQLRDGSIHRVLKNFPSEDELNGMVANCAIDSSYCALDNFWLFQYVYQPS